MFYFDRRGRQTLHWHSHPGGGAIPDGDVTPPPTEHELERELSMTNNCGSDGGGGRRGQDKDAWL